MCVQGMCALYENALSYEVERSSSLASYADFMRFIVYSWCWNCWRAMQRRWVLGVWHWALHLCFLLICCLQNVLGHCASKCKATGLIVTAEAMVLRHKTVGWLDWSIAGYCPAHWCTCCSKYIVLNLYSEKKMSRRPIYSIYQSVYVPTLSYDHELIVSDRKMRFN